MLFHIIIGKTVRQLREKRKWRQEDLAIHSALQRTQIIRLESGRYKNVGIITLQKVARALDVHITALLKDCPKD